MNKSGKYKVDDEMKNIIAGRNWGPKDEPRNVFYLTYLNPHELLNSLDNHGQLL